VNAEDYWLIAVAVGMWIGSVVLGYMSARERDRAWREFLDRGIHPTLWRKENDGGS
jgi:DNA-binding transcriptional regulator of glucitol operon